MSEYRYETHEAVDVRQIEIAGKARAMKQNRWWWLAFCLPWVSACRMFGEEPPVDPAASKQPPPFSVPTAKPGVAYERFIILGDFGTTVPDPQTDDEKQ